MSVPTHFTVDHACGHQAEHDLTARPGGRREGFARWLATRTCTDCWIATRDQHPTNGPSWQGIRRAEEEAAAQWETQVAMPPLDGSDRAVSWASRCRHQLVLAAHTILVLDGTLPETAWARIEEQARTITLAGWWIDQRDADGGDLPELLAAATDTGRSATENPYR